MPKYWRMLLLAASSSAVAQNSGVFPPDSVKKTIAAVAIEAQLRIDGVRA